MSGGEHKSEACGPGIDVGGILWSFGFRARLCDLHVSVSNFSSQETVLCGNC